MIEMVSNVRILNEIGSSPRRNEGARCSKRVLAGMCSQMAQTSSNSTGCHVGTNNNIKTDIDDDLIDFDCHSKGPCSSSNVPIVDSGDVGTTIPVEEDTHRPAISLIGPLFAPDDFEVLEPLGEGFFSKVFKVRHESTGEVLVLKVGKSAGVCRRTSHADTAREAAMMRRLRHENVLELRGICISVDEGGQWEANLLVSYCDGGSLARLLLDRQHHLSWHQRVRYSHDIASAMAYLHSQNIIHRDLTSMNVLIKHRGETPHGWGKAVVADFGLSCPFPERAEKLAQVGTTYFMSPECLKEEFYDEKADVFSFGIILCQIIARIDADPDGGLQRTSNFGLDYMLFTPLCPLDTPIELLKLAFHSCLLDPSARPSFDSAQAKIAEILVALPPMSISRSPDVAREGKETRLGRSRSDATLKRPKCALQQTTSRKLSSNLNATFPRPLVEGELLDETSVQMMQKLARDVARDEPEFNHGNPFLDHERFRNQRKIFPKKVSSTPRRRSETKTDGVTDTTTSSMIHVTPRRRCLSLPCAIESPLDDYEYVVDVTRATRRGYDAALEDSDGVYMSANVSPASGIPMAYRDFDRKFLKQMKRFPSRRHTLIPECAGPITSSVSTFDVSMTSTSDDVSTSLCMSPLTSRRLAGGRDLAMTKTERSRKSSGKTKKSSPVVVPRISEEDSSCPENECRNTVDTVVVSSHRRRFNRVCSSRNVNDCSIL